MGWRVQMDFKLRDDEVSFGDLIVDASVAQILGQMLLDMKAGKMPTAESVKTWAPFVYTNEEFTLAKRECAEIDEDIRYFSEILRNEYFLFGAGFGRQLDSFGQSVAYVTGSQTWIQKYAAKKEIAAGLYAQLIAKGYDFGSEKTKYETRYGKVEELPNARQTAQTIYQQKLDQALTGASSKPEFDYDNVRASVIADMQDNDIPVEELDLGKNTNKLSLLDLAKKIGITDPEGQVYITLARIEEKIGQFQLYGDDETTSKYDFVNLYNNFIVKVIDWYQFNKSLFVSMEEYSQAISNGRAAEVDLVDIDTQLNNFIAVARSYDKVISRNKQLMSKEEYDNLIPQNKIDTKAEEQTTNVTQTESQEQVGVTADDVVKMFDHANDEELSSEEQNALLVKLYYAIFADTDWNSKLMLADKYDSVAMKESAKNMNADDILRAQLQKIVDWLTHSSTASALFDTEDVKINKGDYNILLGITA